MRRRDTRRQTIGETVGPFVVRYVAGFMVHISRKEFQHCLHVVVRHPAQAQTVFARTAQREVARIQATVKARYADQQNVPEAFVSERLGQRARQQSTARLLPGSKRRIALAGLTDVQFMHEAWGRPPVNTARESHRRSKKGRRLCW